MAESITDKISVFFDNENDISKFKDKKYRADFTDKIKSQMKDTNESSIRAIITTQLQKRVKREGLDPLEFGSKSKAKFNEKMNIDVNSEQTDTPADQTKIKTQNPNATLSKKIMTNEEKEKRLRIIPITVNSTLNSIYGDDWTSFSDDDKDSMTVSLNYLIGDYLDKQEFVVKIIGALGILSVLQRGISKAHKKRKARKLKEKQDKKIENMDIAQAGADIPDLQKILDTKTSEKDIPEINKLEFPQFDRL